MTLEAQVADLEFRLREVVRERDEAYADRSRARAERDEALRERNAVQEAMLGYVVFIGPCAHGDDPWYRCDECGEDNALWAATKAVTARTAERDEARAALAGETRVSLDFQKQRDEARAEAEEWRKVARYYLGKDFADSNGPKECQKEAVRRALESDEARAELVSLTQQLELEREHSARLQREAEERHDELRAEVERLRAALETVMLCSHPPTGKACNCFRQGEAALRRSAPLVTGADK